MVHLDDLFEFHLLSNVNISYFHLLVSKTTPCFWTIVELLLIYRFSCSLFQTALTLYLQPSDPQLHVRALRTLIEIGLPEPDDQVLGSNLTARYAHFDGIRVLIYEPVHRPNELIPAVVYFHGGGYALGSTSKLILRDEEFKIFCFLHFLSLKSR